MEFKIANTSYLEDLSNGNAVLIRQIVELFLEQTPGDIDQLMARIQEQDWDAVHKQAHYLKPTMVYVGAKDLHEQITTIDRLAKGREELHKLPEMANSIMPQLAILYEELAAYLHTLD
jgi:HPt (histidine-containing phosphotransfer) domain-containing protein